MLVDIADDLLWEHIEELRREGLTWELDCMDAVVKAHNALNGIYCHDVEFMKGTTEQDIRHHFNQALLGWIKKGGEE